MGFALEDEIPMVQLVYNMKQQMPSFLGTCCCSCVPRHAHQPLGLSSSYGSWITGGHWREVSWSSAHTNRIGVCTSARSLTCRTMVWSSFPTFSLGKELLLPSARRCLTGSASSFFQSAERNESSMVGNLNVRWLGSPRRLSTRHYACLDARIFLKHPNLILLAERWFHSLWSLRIPLP